MVNKLLILFRRFKYRVQLLNYCDSTENDTHWKDMLHHCRAQAWKVGSKLVYIKEFFGFTKCKYWFLILHFLLHTCPAYVIDIVFERLGHKPM